MLMYFFYGGIILYLIGIPLYISGEIIEGYGSREITPRDMRMGLMWPLLVLIGFLRFMISILNLITKNFLLIFGFYYKDTVIHRIIDKWGL